MVNQVEFLAPVLSIETSPALTVSAIREVNQQVQDFFSVFVSLWLSAFCINSIIFKSKSNLSTSACWYLKKYQVEQEGSSKDIYVGTQ